MKDRLNEGETLFAEGKIEAAKGLFLDLFQEDPQNPEVSNNLGVVYHALGDLKKAEEYFRKSLSLRDDDSDCLRNLADLCNAQKRWQEASEYLEKSVSVQDNDPTIYNQLATIYLELGEVQKAKAALGESLRIDGDQEIIKESLKELEKAEASSETCQESAFFKAAFVEVDITPQVSEQYPILLQGFSGSPRKATDKSTSLMMQLLLLEDRHFTKLLIVSADIFGFGPEIVERVRLAAKKWGIEPEGIILNASHTHYAPGTISHAAKSLGPFYNQYAEHICKSITEQLPCLYERLEACDLFSGKTDVQIGVNRRLEKDGEIVFAPNNAGYYETHTPFLLVHLKNSKEKIVLINHGCHPTGSEMESRISGDFPAYMRNWLSQNGLVKGVMFLQGAAGSSKQIGSAGEGNRFGENENIDRENGETLATQISKALESELEPVEGFFFGVRKTVALPLKPFPDAVEIQTIRDNSDSNQLTREWAANLLKRYPNGNFPTRIEMELQSVSIGEGIIFLSIPGEPVAELAKELIPLTHNPDGTFILGYTNGLMAYIPTDRMINELGYETDFSLFAYLLPSAFDRGTESAVITTAKACIEDIHRKDVPNGYGRHHLAKGENEAFFVLSAGRCGTMTLAHLLGTAANASVWHHPQPDPIKESLLAYWDSIDKRAAFWKARQPVIYKAWAEDLIHGETDILMTPFCDMIAKEIPDSKFIVLVRNPWDFVRSGMRRNYYCGHPWDFGRLHPVENTTEHEEWSVLNQFEKICWLWRETYERILAITDSIPKHRVQIVRFEDLIEDRPKIKEIFQFLGLEGYDESQLDAILQRKLNAQTVGEFPDASNWPADLRENLWKECQKVAERFDYQWHEEPDQLKQRITYSHNGQQEKSRIVFITGMHRSGTSFLSRALNLCGLELPDPDMQGNEANLKGRWENVRLSMAGRRLFGAEDRWFDPVIINSTEEVLSQMQEAIGEYTGTYKKWGWKDPRTLINFEYWKKVLPPDTGFNLVVSLRNPLEVARSLSKRNGISIEDGLRLWERYNRYTLQYIEMGYPVHLFNFNATDLRGELSRLCEELKLNPDDRVWNEWFDKELVHQSEHRVPDLPLYIRLLNEWKRQSGMHDERFPSPDECYKPSLALAILMVNGKYNYKDKLWLELSLSNITKYTSPYTDYQIFLWNHDHENQKVISYLKSVAAKVEVMDETRLNVHSYDSPTYDFPPHDMLNFYGFHAHRTPLQILYDHVSAHYAVDTIFSLDTDSWPITHNWDVQIMAELQKGHKMVGVWRDEMKAGIEPYVHASGLGIKARTVAKEGLRFDAQPPGLHEDTLSNFTRILSKKYTPTTIARLKRSNRLQYHNAFGGIYGHLIYHHHKGTSYKDGKQQRITFKGSDNRKGTAEANKHIGDAITERVFYDHDNYIQEMQFGETYSHHKMLYYFLKNNENNQRYHQFLEIAEADKDSDPEKSYYLLNLIIKRYSFHRPALCLMAEVCEKLKRYKEAEIYLAIAHRQNPEDNRLIKQLARIQEYNQEKPV